MWKVLFSIFTAPHAAAHGVSCAATANHVVHVALAERGVDLGDRRDAVDETIDRLAEECRDDRWTAANIACLENATGIVAVHACRPEVHRPLAELPQPVADADLGCPAVGAHLAGLMIDSTYESLLDQDSIVASVLVDKERLVAAGPEMCVKLAWSESLRACYAAATRYAETVACNRTYRDND